VTPRQLVALNMLLIVASGGLVVYAGWQFTRPLPDGGARVRTNAPAAQPPAPAPAPPQTAPGAYTGIASRNLFSPTRTEAPPTPMANTPAAPPMPKPNLYGVVLRDEAPIAYLEDPVTKRVAGYRVGDVVAGGTVQRIAADRVVLVRPDGPIDVRLHDPSKPRPAVPPTGQPQAGLPARIPAIQPGLPVGSGQPMAPGVGTPDSATLPTGRRLPPSLLRRLPPQAGAPADAPPR